MAESFSRRNNLRPSPSIQIREGAPQSLRDALPMLAREVSLSADSLRWAVCRALRCTPDQSNYSPDYVWNEAVNLIRNCEWYEVYDIAEALYAKLTDTEIRGRVVSPEPFQSKLNEVFVENGIGWVMVDGKVQFRGGEGFDRALGAARAAAETSDRPTAAGQLAEALRDMSRRPEPDHTGAIQHSFAALECVARDVTGQPTATLGALMQRFKAALDIPKPLDAAVEKLWGFGSEFGRHLQEGRPPKVEEAELVVTVCAGLVTYLCRPKREDAVD